MPALRESLTFQQRALDDNGDRLGAWGAVVTLAAQITPLTGGQAVMDQRLQGKQPVAIVVRSCAASRGIDNSFRAVNARNTTVVYDVTAAVLSQDRMWVNILAVIHTGQPNG